MTIDLVNHNNEQFVGNLLVGDARKEIPVMFDTGSSLMYLLTNGCDEASCPQEIRYNPNSSSSFRKGNEAMERCYGQGCVSGGISSDLLCFS